MSESHFELVTRQGIERTITEAVNAGDMPLADAQLDIYPYGKKRAEIAMDIEHLIRRDREQDLISFRKAA